MSIQSTDLFTQNTQTKFTALLRMHNMYYTYTTKGAYIYDSATSAYLAKIERYWQNLTNVCDTILPTIGLKTTYMPQIKHFLNNSDAHMYDSNNLYFKPTSEAILYTSTYFHNKVKTYKDLPVRIHAYNRVYRNEDRSKPFIRDSEIIAFSETHEAYVDSIDANAVLQRLCGYYTAFLKYLDIPHILLRRPAHDTFMGAVATYAFDTVIDDKRLQIATVHDLGFNFAKIYNIQYKVKQNVYAYPHQFSYGHSQRILYATLYTHCIGNTLHLPAQLRLTEAIFVDTAVTHIHSDIDHSIFCTEKNYKKTLIAAKFRDSIILIVKEGSKTVKVINRKHVYYVCITLVAALRLRHNQIETTCVYNFNVNKVPYCKQELEKEDTWGVDLSHRYIYKGNTF